MAGNKRYVKFHLFKRKDVPNAIEVDGLNLQNHMNTKQNLAADQVNAGLPPPVFRYAFEGLMATLASGPYKKVFVQGTQHYGVSKLYQRVSGFRPSGVKQAEHMEMLDSFRKSARKWPEEYRLKSVDQLVAALGSFWSGTANPLQKVWDVYVKTGELPAGAQIIKNAEGVEYALVVNTKGKYTVQFINVMEGAPRELYNWRTMNNRGMTQMMRDAKIQ